MGLVLFHNNEKIREGFADFVEESGYKDSYSTKNEEFFYRWGLASLFHDVAYPIEITVKQLNEYYHFTTTYGIESPAQKYLDIQGFEDYKIFHEVSPTEQYKKEFLEKYPDFDNLEEGQSCKLLATDLAKTFNLKCEVVLEKISNYDEKISLGIIDHAYFGALICLKWHSALINRGDWNPAYLHFPVLDASVSIFLHNAYKYLFVNELKLGPLRYKDKPIAFLLILSDILQEWGRQEYGVDLPQGCAFKDVDLVFCEESGKLVVRYLVSADSEKDLESDLKSVLSLNDVFDSFQVKYEKEGDSG